MNFDPIVGYAFDPKAAHMARIYVPEFVDAIPGTELGDLPKRLYTRMYRLASHANRNNILWRGYVYWSIDNHAASLGRSTAAIRRAFKDLERLGLIDITRPDRRLNNRTYFLWAQLLREGFKIGRDAPPPPPPKPRVSKAEPLTVKVPQVSTAKVPNSSTADRSPANGLSDREGALYKGMSFSVPSSAVQKYIQQPDLVFHPDEHMMEAFKSLREALAISNTKAQEKLLAGLEQHATSVPLPTSATRLERAIQGYEATLLRKPPAERFELLKRLRSLTTHQEL